MPQRMNFRTPRLASAAKGPLPVTKSRFALRKKITVDRSGSGANTRCPIALPEVSLIDESRLPRSGFAIRQGGNIDRRLLASQRLGDGVGIGARRAEHPAILAIDQNLDDRE